jgi:hypothetical protein
MKQLSYLTMTKSKISGFCTVLLSVLVIAGMTTPGIAQSLTLSVQPTVAVGNGPSGIGLINTISFQKAESRWSTTVGLGMHTLYHTQYQLPFSSYRYSTIITLEEVDERGKLGGEVDEETYLKGKERGIGQLTPKKDFRNDRYIFAIMKWDAVRSAKSVLSLGVGLGLGLTDRMQNLGGYTASSHFSEMEHLVHYEFSQRLKYIHWGVMNRVEYAYHLKEQIHLNAVLGYYYIPLNSDFFISDERIIYVSLGCSFVLN